MLSRKEAEQATLAKLNATMLAAAAPLTRGMPRNATRISTGNFG
jgi:hypothetical protein